MIRFPPPPEHVDIPIELLRWLRLSWEYARGSAKKSGDENATIGSGQTYHGVTGPLTAPRTLTLPPSKELQDGDGILIQDESGDAGTHTITIQVQGDDEINGFSDIEINSNLGRKYVVKSGEGKYFSE